jgi:hypothetical protein
MQNAFPVIGDAIAKFRRDLKVLQAFDGKRDRLSYVDLLN